MRRSDREVTDPAAIQAIIRACDCCRLGISDGETPYVVPLNFGYCECEGAYTFFFHCAPTGKKLHLLEKNPNVGFELDTNHAVNTAETACGYSFRFQSVIGKGYIVKIEDPVEKKDALQRIMEHYSNRDDWPLSEESLEGVTLLRLNVQEMTCKEHR